MILQPKCKVIMMTGYSTAGTVDKAVELGAYAYLFKPFEDIIELEKFIEEAVRLA